MNNKLSVYVAGAWIHRHELKEIMRELRETYGFNVISGWIERENGVNTPEALASDASFDVDEVSSADVLLAVMDDPKYAYRGTFTEIGCAAGLKKKIVIVCPGTKNRISDDRYEYSHYCMTNVFFWHPSISHCTNIDDAIDQIKSF